MGALLQRGVLESWADRAGLLRPCRVGRAQLSPGRRSPRRHGPPRPRLATSGPTASGGARGIARGATPHLVLSSTLEPPSALSECSRPAQCPVLRAQPVYRSARVTPARPATCMYQKQNSPAPELTPSPPTHFGAGLDTRGARANPGPVERGVYVRVVLRVPELPGTAGWRGEVPRGGRPFARAVRRARGLATRPGLRRPALGDDVAARPLLSAAASEAATATATLPPPRSKPPRGAGEGAPDGRHYRNVTSRRGRLRRRRCSSPRIRQRPARRGPDGA